MKLQLAVTTTIACMLSGCGDGGKAAVITGTGEVDLISAVARNRLAYIPPQCFTRTQDTDSAPVQNPCYVCHADTSEPNYNSQPELQLAYAFPQAESGHDVVNHWSNLFKDRSAEMAALPDAEIRQYVNQDNYLDASGQIILAHKLASLPAAWDANRDSAWNGYVPDVYMNFDNQGFDRAPDGHATGWRTFAYYPFPGAFMPTNGAFDDVLIRLPLAFRQTSAGVENLNIYAINLALVESLMKRTDIPIPAADETTLGVDLDNDGKLATATKIAYHWNPTSGDFMYFVGRAKDELAAGHLHLAAGLFPEGTEFLHSVRYLAVDPNGNVVPAPRMKELRYSRKKYWMSYADLQLLAKREAKDKVLNPDQPELYGGDSEHGLNNSVGWTYQGFIEDKNGNLRPQSYEETLFCMGCHTGLSATEDGIFAFPRKLIYGTANGWYHWGSSVPGTLPDATRRDGKLEYTTYLLNNGAGDEFRANTEVKAKFFNADGSPNTAMFDALAKDANVLLLPTAQRAIALDKAYRLLVKEQSFALGRDAMLAPAANVWKEVVQDRATGVGTAQISPRLALP
jgi:hypothetical protein